MRCSHCGNPMVLDLYARHAIVEHARYRCLLCGHIVDRLSTPVDTWEVTQPWVP